MGERDGRVFRILDLGWRHTAQPIRKQKIGDFFYGQWYSMNWGGPPLAVKELQRTFQHSNGILRHMTVRMKNHSDMYKPRNTYYPTLVSNDAIAGTLVHHTHMKTVE